MQEPGGGIAHFELINCKCIDTYVKVKRNQNQICWKWKKVRDVRNPKLHACAALITGIFEDVSAEPLGTLLMP